MIPVKHWLDGTGHTTTGPRPAFSSLQTPSRLSLGLEPCPFFLAPFFVLSLDLHRSALCLDGLIQIDQSVLVLSHPSPLTIVVEDNSPLVTYSPATSWSDSVNPVRDVARLASHVLNIPR